MIFIQAGRERGGSGITLVSSQWHKLLGVGTRFSWTLEVQIYPEECSTFYYVEVTAVIALEYRFIFQLKPHYGSDFCMVFKNSQCFHWILHVKGVTQSDNPTDNHQQTALISYEALFSLYQLIILVFKPPTKQFWFSFIVAISSSPSTKQQTSKGRVSKRKFK